MEGFVQTTDVTCVDVDGDVVLVDAAGAHMITLNRLGGVLWHHLERPRSCSALVVLCRDRHPEVPVPQLEHDITAFLDHAVGLGILSIIDVVATGSDV